ncbi:carboxypeptidase B [Lepeophtheirus salmonis]|uniref:carboxypeptidase B n=1 Tax=Lepeophtheirus salmonis TaxID=72036 RepID=UPI001AE62CC8|nr:carboxypeptidase B-like [Lepeophtheirus salmonis]
MWSKILFLLLLPFFDSVSPRKNYEGYKVIKTDILKSENISKELFEFVHYSANGSLDFWIYPRLQSSSKIMSTPSFFSELEEFLNKRSISFEVIIQNVERTIEIEEKTLKQKKKLKTSRRAIDWNAYYSMDNIYRYLEELEKDNEFVSVVKYGRTFENRDLKLLRIEKAGSNAPNILVEAGIHAREWISPSMATYLMHSLIDVKNNSHYLEKFNFHIIPIANPDGYEYSRVYDRLWRKNRRKNSGSSNCIGVDCNRNWDVYWAQSGVDHNPCSPVYPGVSPFSEAETNSIRRYVERISPTPILSLSLHSAGSLLLIPYGYTNLVLPENYDELIKLAREAVGALNQVHHSNFKAVHSTDLYPASGTSDDWYMKILGSRFAYTFELRQGGPYGFELPSEQIYPSGQELWVAFEVILDKMYNVTS